MKTSKLILFGFWVLLATVSMFGGSYAGEMYETEAYLTATTGEYPYGDPPPPVRSPDLPLPDNGPSNIGPNEPVPNSPDNPNNPDDGGSGSNGNFNSFRFDNQSFRTNQGNSQSNTNGTRNYLITAILTTGESFVRSRGRYAAKARTVFRQDVEAVSALPRLFRKVQDKQIAYKKVQKAVKTPFERCNKIVNVSPSYCYNDIKDGFSTLKQQSLSFNFCTVLA
jgi:hypothetical protein